MPSECVMLNAFFTATILKISRWNTFIRTLGLWLFLSANVCTLSREVEIIIVYRLVGPCHHGMARPQVADGGTASDLEGSCE